MIKSNIPPVEVTGVTLDKTVMIVDLKTVTEVVAINPLDLIRTHQEEDKVEVDLIRVQM